MLDEGVVAAAELAMWLVVFDLPCKAVERNARRAPLETADQN